MHNINVEEEQSVVLAGLLSAARPLVGLRVKENEEWFHPGPGSLPLLAFYCDLEGKPCPLGTVSCGYRGYPTQSWDTHVGWCLDWPGNTRTGCWLP